MVKTSHYSKQQMLKLYMSAPLVVELLKTYNDSAAIVLVHCRFHSDCQTKAEAEVVSFLSI